MTDATVPITIERVERLPTWFGVGGGAERFARVSSVAALIAALEIDPDLRVLGDGANLLVDDAGVHNLVVEMTDELRGAEMDTVTGRVIAGGGARLPQLITGCVRAGLGGLEALAGIPASVGGAVVMNAGGAFGEIAEFVERVHALDRAGRPHDIPRDRIDFSYRHSGLNHLLITGVEFRLIPGDPEALRERLKQCMDYKKRTQPLAEDSAGCVFRNPTLPETIEDIGAVGERVSAGKLIDLAGCKGLRVGGAIVSDRHANFIVVEEGATARDILALTDAVAERVLERFGVKLEREIVVWSDQT